VPLVSLPITTDILEWLHDLYNQQLTNPLVLYYFKHTVVVPRSLKAFFRRCFAYVTGLRSSHRLLGYVLECIFFSMICGPTGTESSGSRLTEVLAVRMRRFLALDWIALFAESRAAAPPSFDHADESVDQANQRRYDTARRDALESNPGRAARTLLGAPLLNPFDPDIEPQVRAQFTPKVAPVPFDDSIEPLVFSDSSYEWKVLDIDISAGDGESISVPSLAFVLDHLPRRKAQDAFGGRFENWGLLPCEAINDAVLDFNNGCVPRGLWCSGFYCRAG
jgi:hypothetical protein